MKDPALDIVERVPWIPENVARNKRRFIVPKQKCTATSKGTGVRCRMWAIKGSNVCRIHGAARGTVARAAADDRIAATIVSRIEKAAGDAMTVLEKLVETDEAGNFATDDKTALAAARDVLDRAGHVAVRKQQVEVAGVFAEVNVDDQIEQMLADRAKDGT